MAKRTLKELNLLDNFLFHEVISYGSQGAVIIEKLLSTILGRKISNIKVIPQKTVYGCDTAYHGICLDAYIEGEDPEDGETEPEVYDLEPNLYYEKKGLPYRTRFYHALIDSKLLETGNDYETMKNVYIIMILPYDPFGKNRMVYTIQNKCVEDEDVIYKDGVTIIYLFTKGTEGNPSKELSDMLKYFEDSREENAVNQDIREIHGIVKRVKSDREVSVNYMKSWEYEAWIRKEATREGREEGRKEGREKGIEEGREKGIEEGRKEGREEGYKLGIEHVICKMLSMNISEDIISQTTGFSKERISELAQADPLD